MFKKQHIITICALALFSSAIPLMGAEERGDFYTTFRQPCAGEKDEKVLSIVNMVDNPLWVRIKSGQTFGALTIVMK